MVSMVRVRNFLQIVHTFENYSKCFQKIHENVVNWAAGVLLLVCISMSFLILCWTFDFFPYSEHDGRFFMNSFILIFSYFCPEYFKAHSATVLVNTTMNIFPMFIRVLLAGKWFITKFTHHSFQILLSYLRFCQISYELVKPFLPSCIFILCCFKVNLDMKFFGIGHILHIYSVCLYCDEALV